MPDWGVIFDLDGVLVESGVYHRDAWKAFAENHGTEMSDEFFWSTFGERNAELLPRILGRDLSAEQTRRLSEEKEQRFRDAATGRLKMLPGAWALIQALNQWGVPMAIGSSTPRSNMEFFLDELGLRKVIQTVVCGDDVTTGKPDPEVFLKAAERLGCSPTGTVVVEDAVSGVKAAKAAGAACLALTTSVGRADLESAGADRVETDLSGLSVTAFRELVSVTKSSSLR